MPRNFRTKPTVNGRGVHLDGDAAISPLNSSAPIGSYPVGSTGFYYTSTQTGWPDYPGFVRTLKTSSTEAFQILTDIYGESERARSWDSAAVAWRGWTVVNSGNFASFLHGHNAATAGGASGFMTGADKTKLDGLGGGVKPALRLNYKSTTSIANALSPPVNTWVNLGPQHSFTLISGTSLTEILVSGYIAFGGAAGVFAYARILVDGLTVVSVGGNYAVANTFPNLLAGNNGFWLDSLAAGAHTVQFQVRSTASTGFYCRSDTGEEVLTIQVVEHA